MRASRSRTRDATNILTSAPDEAALGIARFLLTARDLLSPRHSCRRFNIRCIVADTGEGGAAHSCSTLTSQVFADGLAPDAVVAQDELGEERHLSCRDHGDRGQDMVPEPDAKNRQPFGVMPISADVYRRIDRCATLGRRGRVVALLLR